MANPHSTPDFPDTGTERSIIVGYRPHGLDKSTPSLTLSGKWLRPAGFETGQAVTVKVMQGCIVLMSDSPKALALHEELKTTQQALKDIQASLADITPQFA